MVRTPRRHPSLRGGRSLRRHQECTVTQVSPTVPPWAATVLTAFNVKSPR